MREDSEQENGDIREGIVGEDTGESEGLAVTMDMEIGAGEI